MNFIVPVHSSSKRYRAGRDQRVLAAEVVAQAHAAHQVLLDRALPLRVPAREVLLVGHVRDLLNDRRLHGLAHHFHEAQQRVAQPHVVALEQAVALTCQLYARHALLARGVHQRPDRLERQLLHLRAVEDLLDVHTVLRQSVRKKHLHVSVLVRRDLNSSFYRVVRFEALYLGLLHVNDSFGLQRDARNDHVFGLVVEQTVRLNVRRLASQHSFILIAHFRTLRLNRETRQLASIPHLLYL